MILGVLPASALAVGEVPALLSVQEGINVSVSYGTDAETAKLSLPTQVTVEVEDLSPLAEVTPVSLDFNGEERPSEINYFSDDITVQDGKLHFENRENIKATMGLESMTDYVVEAELQCAEQTPTADYGIMFRTTEACGDGPDSYHGLYVGLGVLDFNAKPVKYGLKVGYADGLWHDIKMYEYAWDAGLIDGTSATTFRPDHCRSISDRPAPRSGQKHKNTAALMERCGIFCGHLTWPWQSSSYWLPSGLRRRSRRCRR